MLNDQYNFLKIKELNETGKKIQKTGFLYFMIKMPLFCYLRAFCKNMINNTCIRRTTLKWAKKAKRESIKRLFAQKRIKVQTSIKYK